MSERKKVLIIAAALCIGGAEKVVRDIGLYSDPEKLEIHYLVFGERIGEYEQELREHGCRIIHFDSPGKGYLKFYRRLRKLIGQNRYSVVHAHTMFNIGLAMLAAHKEKVPIRIAHAHSALKDGGGATKRIYEGIMRKMILRHATDLLACGKEAGKRLYGEKAFAERGRVILNGIGIRDYAYNASAGQRIRTERQIRNAFVIGHAGHFAPVKNQRFLIRLMPEILKRRPGAKLILLGDGEDSADIEKLIGELGLQDTVILTGNVMNVGDYLSAMDVFAFPSLYEGMPLSIVEVQANGLPCVLSETVPKDVCLTDLICALPLDDPSRWVDAICSSARKDPEKYAEILKDSGLDTSVITEKYHKLYLREESN